MSFHGGLQLSDLPALSTLKPAVLIRTGAADPLVPEVDMKAVELCLRSGNADWQIHIYGNVLHAFTDPDIDAAGTAGRLMIVRLTSDPGRQCGCSSRSS